MKITRKRLSKIRRMKKQSARKYKKGGKKKRKRTLRSRRVNLKKRTIRNKMKGGDKIQEAIESYNNQISNLKKRLPFLEKRQLKIKAELISKKNELLKKRKVSNIKQLPESDRTVLKNYIVLKRENQKEIDNIPIKISNIEVLIQRLKRDAMNAHLVNTLKQASSLKKSGIDSIKKVQPDVEAEIDRGVTIPKVVTTIVKTLKDNKGKILSPGYIVDVIQDPDGVSASTGTSILSNAISRKKSIISTKTQIPTQSLPKMKTISKSLTVNKPIKDIVPNGIQLTAPHITPSTPTVPTHSIVKTPETKQSVESVLNPKPNPKPNPTPNPKTNPKPNPKTNPKPNPTPNPKTNPKPNPKPNPTPNPKTKTKKKAPITSTQLIMKLIMNMQQKKLKIILNKLKVTNAKGDAKSLKKLIIQRYKKIKPDDLYKSLKALNKRKDFSVMKGDSKVKMLSSYINLLKRKTLKRKVQSRKRGKKVYSV
jgi:hypothetical protein